MADLFTIFTGTLKGFSPLDWILLTTNALLLLTSRPIIERFTSKSQHQQKSLFADRLSAFRALNIIVFALVLFFNLMLPLADKHWVARILSLFIVVYVSQVVYHVAAWGIQRRYGKQRTVAGGKVEISETYNSRALKLLSAFLLGAIALLSMINILGFDSLLEAGGVIGFLGVLLALTQATWAPDIVSGLIILNSNLLEEGDVIQIDGADKPLHGVIYKTKMFHTEILSIVNNHRIMFRNSQLRECVIHNFSKFASAKGLREVLHFKIGYDENRRAIEGMFDEAFAEAAANPDIHVEGSFPTFLYVEDTGDDAVTWGFYYYTRDIRNFLKTRHQVRAIILKKSLEMNISLATPDLFVLEKSGAFGGGQWKLQGVQQQQAPQQIMTKS